MNHLKVPDTLACARIKGQQTVTEEICTSPIRSVEIVFRAADGDVDDPSLLVDSEVRPGVCTSDCFPSLFRPSVVAEFARMGNGMEDPDLLARAHIVCAYVARCRFVFLICC